MASEKVLLVRSVVDQPTSSLIRPFEFLASSTGLLLKTTGLKVTSIKIDPYMNIDAGTMRPTEHGKRTSLCRPSSPERRLSKAKYMSSTTAEK